MNQISKQKILDYLKNCIEENVFCGTNVCIRYKNETEFFTLGDRAIIPDREKNDIDTIYDMASLTKVIVTTPLILIAIRENKISFQTLVKDILQDFPFDDITIKDLLTHTSGLDADIKVDNSDTLESVWHKIKTGKRIYDRNTHVLYSDLGYITLGFILEKIYETDLKELSRKYLLCPMDMKDSGYNIEESKYSRCAPTEKSVITNLMRKGQVHDEKATVMKGISGHAGFFSTITDMSHVLEMLLNHGYYKDIQILTEEELNLFETCFTPQNEIRRSIGYLLKDERSPFSEFNTSKAYMHTGFCGTSILIDRELELGIIILSNRVHPTRENTKIYEKRKEIHNFILKTLKEENLC